MHEGGLNPLLLDTHVWIWVMEGMREMLSKPTVEEIGQASEWGGVRVSAISVWEVAMLEAKGRIALSRPIRKWVEEALTAPGTQFVNLSPAAAIESTHLPGALHGDPADRILVATARVAGATLVTRDVRILEYGRGGYLSVMDARP